VTTGYPPDAPRSRPAGRIQVSFALGGQHASQRFANIDAVSVQIVFETHALSQDNERGLASGWLPGRLSERGRALARELGERRVADGLAAVFTSDLRRALETVELAFADSGPPVLVDWRLRECDYGSLNGASAAQVLRERRRRLTMPYPDGESWEQAVRRVGRFVGDLPLRWTGQRVLVIGHVATRWAFDHLVNGVRLEDLIEEDFGWQEGWEYELDESRMSKNVAT
jgi:alpha-ribazole phosphatase/probable phosphoglycerate mutase